MLCSATKTLKNFVPKTAICTYHLLDDPKILEDIIMDANSSYTIFHTRHKLFAAVL